MKYLDSYRDPNAARVLVEELGRALSRPWTVAEVCGGQASHLARSGMGRSLPEGLVLVHGPGCPVSVVPVSTIDLAVRVAGRPGAVVCVASGDLLQVPGRGRTLTEVRDGGGDVRVVYSPLDALALARNRPESEVVYLSVGFETTAPTAAAAVMEAERLGLDNFSLALAHLRASSAISAVLDAPGRSAQAVLAPGHVASVIGLREYEGLAERYRVPVVVIGPEPADLLDGLLRAVRQLESGRAGVENQYARAVRPGGNPHALATIATVFEHADVPWRGLGALPASGLALAERFRKFDASARFRDGSGPAVEPGPSPCQEVLDGRVRPPECAEFGKGCTPAHALGPAMLSSEGACAGYYRSRRAIDGVADGNRLVVIGGTSPVPGACSGTR